MELETINTTMEAARKLFITKQYMNGNTPGGSFSDKLQAIIDGIGYIQWDPVTVVAPSHLISLWSRIGNFKWAELDRILWEEKAAFFHWVPTAWIVNTADYPIYYSLMKRYPESLRKGWSSHIPAARKALESNPELRTKVIERLRDGPVSTGAFKDLGKRTRSADGWSSGNEVSNLLFHLHMAGEVMVSGHSGNQNVWSLAEAFLPKWAMKELLPASELERVTAMRSLKALGVAPELDVNRYFIRGRYSDLKGTLVQLREEGSIVRVEVEGQPRSRPLHLLSEDKRLLDRVASGNWEEKLNLLSPFDNLITLRDRLKRMFGFDYILEQFVPREKRRYGTYVLPILWGHNIVGRLDAKMDKPGRTLNINAIFAEPGYEGQKEIGHALAEKIVEFGTFLGAEKVAFGKVKPAGWSSSLR